MTVFCSSHTVRPKRLAFPPDPSTFLRLRPRNLYAIASTLARCTRMERSISHNLAIDKRTVSSRLPMELVQQILHEGAQSSTAFCLQLSLVASWARQIANFHLYTALTISRGPTRTQLSILAHCFEIANRNQSTPRLSPKPPQLVQSCWMSSNSPTFSVRTHVPQILAQCPQLSRLCVNVIELASLAEIDYKRSDLQIMLQVPFAHSTSVLEFFGEVHFIADTRSYGFYANVTHLRFMGMDDYHSPLPMRHFTRLTHMGVPFYGRRTQQLDALGDWALVVPSLQVLVIFVYGDLMPEGLENDVRRREVEEWVQSFAQHRVKVRMWEGSSGVVKAEWEEEGRGGISIWAKATRG